MQTVNLNNLEINPSKIVCIGRNFVAHIQELHNEVPTNMVLFMKPNSAISKNLHAGIDDEIHYEAEISFLLHAGKITGVGLGLDLTKRGIQTKLKEKGLPWERAKAFDGAAVFSDFVSLDCDINTLSLKLFIDGILVQEGGVSLMIYKPDEIVSEVASFMTLYDGDILMSGTPKGVGIVKKGEKFLGQILSEEGILIQQEWIAQ